MRSQRREFSKKIKLEAWDRAKGRCENCGQKIIAGNGPEYHHIIEAAIDGGNNLGNCQVLCMRPCHKSITSNHAPQMAKTRAVFEKRAGTRKSSRPMAGSKASGWKRKMDGTTVRR